MNNKKAKQIRKHLKNIGIDWTQKSFEESTHPKEQPHQKVYSIPMQKYTKVGIKTIFTEIPMKVGTQVLNKYSGKKLYRENKKPL